MQSFSSGERKKPRVGFYKFSCCSGCGFELGYFQAEEETLKAFDYRFFRLISSGGSPRDKEPLDIALVEGTVTEPWQVEELKLIRARSELLYAVGSCAITGGIPAIKATAPEEEVQGRVYREKLFELTSLRPSTLADYVSVDGFVRGCPPGRKDVVEALSSALMGKGPEFTDCSVCVECKVNGYMCVLVAYGMPCMGPVTNAGCGALCPSFGRDCYSCFGFMRQANLPALMDKFKQMGLSDEDVGRRFSLFGALGIKK